MAAFSQPEKYGGFETTQPLPICAISLAQTDRIRIHDPNGPAAVMAIAQLIRPAIQTGWAYGIQSERDYYGSFEFKMAGNPWTGHGDEAVHSRRLLTAILRTMSQVGWTLIQCCDLSKKANDKDTLFFELGPPDPHVQMFAVSFNMTDRIRLIEFPGKDILETFRSIVTAGWPYGVQSERDYNGAYEMKLSGNPWWTNDGQQIVTIKTMLCSFLSAFRRHGYKLYASADINGVYSSSNSNTAGELESWVFRKISPNWH